MGITLSCTYDAAPRCGARRQNQGESCGQARPAPRVLTDGLDEALHLLHLLHLLDRLQRERVHDARSVVVGVLGASELLTTSHGSALRDPPAVHRMMTAELTRMSRLLDADLVEQITEFDLAGALVAAVTAHRLAGARIDCELATVAVRGLSGLTATAVGNLLTNATRHAPGATVTVRASTFGAVVHVVVEDDGPGIAVHERAEVLHAGVRGTGARGPGSGLGLSSAAAAMTAQSGGLRIEERPGGGTRIVLSLPAAGSATAGAARVEAQAEAS